MIMKKELNKERKLEDNNYKHLKRQTDYTEIMLLMISYEYHHIIKIKI